MGKRYVWSKVCTLLMSLAVGMLATAIVGLYYMEPEGSVFLYMGAGLFACSLAGYALLRPPRKKAWSTSLRDSYALVAYGWIVCALVGMVPYLLCGTFVHVTDALFESMSGLATVGASVMDNLEMQPRCVLFWRSVTHWLGGLWILVLFIAFMLGEGSGSIQILKAESSLHQKGRLHSQTVELAVGLAYVYLFFTGISIVLFYAVGMSAYDAVNHALSAVATGGFSTHDANIGYWGSARIEWAVIAVMLLSGVNYSLYLHAWRNRTLRNFGRSPEFKAYLIIIAIATVMIYVFASGDISGHRLEAVRLALFHVVSVITTTGFYTCDFELWSGQAHIILLLLMLCGACAGSTTSGIKIDRHIIMLKKSVQEIRRFLHPRMVTRLKSEHRIIEEDTVLSIATYFYIYIAIIVGASYVVCALGTGMLDALTSVMSILGGIGPSIGIWGPVETYSSAGIITKWIFIVLMLIGRLEIYTVLVLFHPMKISRKKKQAIRSFEEHVDDNALFEPMVTDK